MKKVNIILNPLKLLIMLIGILQFTVPSFSQALAPEGFNLQGTIFDSSNNPIEAASVSFTVQVFSSDGNSCLLYEETHIKNMSGSKGVFNLIIGAGTRSGVNYEDTSTLALAFDNTLGVQSSLNCAIGSSYNPAPGDSREILLSFDEGSGLQTLTQNLLVQSVPFSQFADNADKLQGKSVSDFLQVNTGTASLSQANLENVFSTTNYNNLVNLLSVDPNNYLKTGVNGSASIPSVSGDPGAGLAAGQIWYDDTGNVVKYYDGTSVQTLSYGPASGDLLSTNNLSDVANAGTARTNLGLAIGSDVQAYDAQLSDVAAVNPTTTSGYLLGSDGTNLVMRSPANARSDLGLGTAAVLNVGTGNNNIVQLDGTAKLPAVDASQVTGITASQIPNLDAAKITTGTLAISRGGTGLTSWGNNSVVVSNGTGTGLSSLNCLSGEVIKFDASGFAICGTDSSGGSGDLVSTNNLSDVANAGTARTNLGLGTAALLSQDSDNTFADGQLVAFHSASMVCAAGEFLTIQGPGPTYSYTCATPAGGGDLVSTNNLSDVANAVTARTNLGLAIGSDVQAFDAQLNEVASINPAISSGYLLGSNGTNLVMRSPANARSDLGLGSAATSNSGDFLQVTNNLSDLNSATTARTNLGLGSAALLSEDSDNSFADGQLVAFHSASMTCAAGEYLTIQGPGPTYSYTCGTPSATDNTKLPLAGGTMSGPLVNNSNSASTALNITQAGAGYAATFMGGNVGIGTTNPTVALEVSGQVKITGGSPGAGKVLQSDATGSASWVEPWAPRVVTVADNTSLTPTSSTADQNIQINTQSTGTLTMEAPTGTPVSGQKIIIRIKSTNIQTFSWNAIYRGSDDLPLPVATTGTSKTDYMGFIYNAEDGKWDLLASVFGF